MTIFEAVLKVSRDNFLVNLSRRFPSMKIFIWCNKEKDVVEIHVKNPEDYSLVMEEVHAHPILGLIEEASTSHRLYFSVCDCRCMNQDTIVRHIGKLDILNIFPNMIENGWVYHRLIVFSHKEFEELLRRLENWGWVYKILRKVSFDGFIASSLTLSADHLFSSLTEKQMDAMLTAYRHGYYSLPRVSDVQTIAAKKRVPRTTFQEHLKKAENKLVTALVPYMQLFDHASPTRKRSIKVK